MNIQITKIDSELTMMPNNKNENIDINAPADLPEISENIYETYDGCCFVFLAWITLPTIFIPIICCKGLFTLEPNEIAVVTLFGNYKGTVRNPGYHWINPWCTVQILSLRRNNLFPPKLNVNDKRGNPIEIGIVLIWRIINPILCTFYVENYTNYLTLQSEAALRHLASSFAYDHAGDCNETTLLHGSDVINKFLVDELNERLKKAGIYVEESRVIHLGYDKNIQNVMLKRQQAEALVGARQKLVEGVASIVRDTVDSLSSTIKFTDESKATLASNLLVILSGENNTLPLMHLNQI